MATAKSNPAFMTGVSEILILRLLADREMHALQERGCSRARRKPINGRTRVYYTSTPQGRSVLVKRLASGAASPMPSRWSWRERSMAPQRRRELAERLLRSEVAPRHVRRLTRELRDHYEDVVRTELARGLPPAAAGRIASERLGTDDRLAQSALAQPELRSTTARRPGLVLGAGPTLLWLGTVMATLAAIRVLPQTGVQASPPTWALL